MTITVGTELGYKWYNCSIRGKTMGYDRIMSIHTTDRPDGDIDTIIIQLRGSP